MNRLPLYTFYMKKPIWVGPKIPHNPPEGGNPIWLVTTNDLVLWVLGIYSKLEPDISKL